MRNRRRVHHRTTNLRAQSRDAGHASTPATATSASTRAIRTPTAEQSSA